MEECSHDLYRVMKYNDKTMHIDILHVQYKENA